MDFYQKKEAWERIARESQNVPITLLSPCEINTRTIQTYNKCFGINLVQKVREKRKSLTHPVVVADFCCGYAKAMEGLKQQLGDDVYTVGFDILNYPNTSLSAFLVADLKEVEQSCIPHLPSDFIDFGFSLFGIPFRFDTHLPNFEQESQRWNRAFFGELNRLFRSPAEGYFHNLPFVSNTWQSLQEITELTFEKRRIEMDEGYIDSLKITKA